MQKLTVVTAALAAGVVTFAFSAADAATWSPRADQGLVAVTKGKATSAKSSRSLKATAKQASAKVEKANWTKAKKSSAKRQMRRGRKTVDMTTTASIGLRNVAASTAAVANSGQYSAIVARYAAS